MAFVWLIYKWGLLINCLLTGMILQVHHVKPQRTQGKHRQHSDAIVSRCVHRWAIHHREPSGRVSAAQAVSGTGTSGNFTRHWVMSRRNMNFQATTGYHVGYLPDSNSRRYLSFAKRE